MKFVLFCQSIGGEKQRQPEIQYWDTEIEKEWTSEGEKGWQWKVTFYKARTIVINQQFWYID